MRNKKIQQMTLYAIFIALIGIATFTPLGFIPLGVASVTTLHIFVLVLAFISDTKGGLVAGLAFGIFSLLRSIISPMSPTDILFRNPLVSVLPRVIFGYLAGLTSSILTKKFGDNLVKKSFLMIISSIILTFIHSLLVLVMMYLFAPTVEEFKNFWNEQSFFVFFSTILVANGILEMVVAGIIVPIVSVPIKKVLERN